MSVGVWYENDRDVFSLGMWPLGEGLLLMVGITGIGGEGG